MYFSLSQILRMCYNCAMNSYDRIYEVAIGNYGIITSSQAKEMGISNAALVQLALRGRLERLGYGVYRIDKYVPNAEGLDAYACAVARVGDGAFLWGPSVLALHHLCPTNPSRIYVASSRRCRAKLPTGIVVKAVSEVGTVENYEGIPIQNVREAILVSQHIIMLNRLLDAVEVAKEKNLIPALDGERIIKELYKND